MSKASPSFRTSESSLRRVDRLAAFAAASLALGGCMVIYPDPELPDLKATWFEDDCRSGTGNVAMTLVGLDATTRTEVAVPCTDVAFTFVDVARERYRVEAVLQDDRGEVFSQSGTEADLRNGFDERIDLYFGAFSNFRVGWTFAMGATCTSLGVNQMGLRFSSPEGIAMFEMLGWCELTPHLGSVPDGTYTLGVRAYSSTGVVATSPESKEFEIAEPGLTDLGIVTLSP